VTQASKPPVWTSIATVRREIGRAFAGRPLEAPQRFARVLVARLIKAMKLAEAAVELGELKAVPIYLRIVAALDRYHELARGSPPLSRSIEAPPRAPPAERQTPTSAAPDKDDSAAIEQAQHAAQAPERRHATSASSPRGQNQSRLRNERWS